MQNTANRDQAWTHFQYFLRKFLEDLQVDLKEQVFVSIDICLTALLVSNRAIQQRRQFPFASPDKVVLQGTQVFF